MSTKIQINSLQALERLIGGDSEFEIEIRNSVVAEFSKKHLKGVADQVLNKYEFKIREDIRNMIEKQLGLKVVFRNYREVVEFNPEVKSTIETAIKNQFENIIKDLLDEQLKSEDLEKYAKNLVDRCVTTRVHDEVLYQVKNKLNGIMEALKNG